MTFVYFDNVMGRREAGKSQTTGLYNFDKYDCLNMFCGCLSVCVYVCVRERLRVCAWCIYHLDRMISCFNPFSIYFSLFIFSFFFDAYLTHLTVNILINTEKKFINTTK